MIDQQLTLSGLPVPVIVFPFWIVIPRSADTDAGCESANHVCTFSSAARAIAYMESRKEGEWDVKLVSRPSRPEIEDFLMRVGINKVCHDQNPDGSGGTSWSVDELLVSWEL